METQAELIVSPGNDSLVPDLTSFPKAEGWHSFTTLAYLGLQGFAPGCPTPWRVPPFLSFWLHLATILHGFIALTPSFPAGVNVPSFRCQLCHGELVHWIWVQVVWESVPHFRETLRDHLSAGMKNIISLETTIPWNKWAFPSTLH